MKVNKVLVRDDKLYYWEKGDFHTDSGIIKEDELKKDVNRVKTHSGKEFFIFPALFIDKIQKIKRAPQAILEKDIAIILTYTGIDNKSVVLEAGSGSGKLTAFLAMVVKSVISYDNNKNNLEIAKDNIAMLELKNVEFKLKNIYEGIDENNLDLVILDLPYPEKVLEYSYSALKNGCFLVAYAPQITQAIRIVRKAKENGFFVVKVIEVIERNWLIDEKRARPKSEQQYTAFICFLRKLDK